jgi:hypothetical protein
MSRCWRIGLRTPTKDKTMTNQTSDSIIKHQIAGGLSIALINAAAAYLSGTTDYETFNKTQRGAFMVAEEQGIKDVLCEELRAAVIEAANLCDPRNRDTRVAAITAYRAASFAFHAALAACSSN